MYLEAKDRLDQKNLKYSTISTKYIQILCKEYGALYPKGKKNRENKRQSERDLGEQRRKTEQ